MNLFIYYFNIQPSSSFFQNDAYPNFADNRISELIPEDDSEVITAKNLAFSSKVYFVVLFHLKIQNMRPEFHRCNILSHFAVILKHKKDKNKKINI